ncbi:hypothetical protein BH24ACT26_BH24ACT26_11210 [soil metagenome]
MAKLTPHNSPPAALMRIDEMRRSRHGAIAQEAPPEHERTAAGSDPMRRRRARPGAALGAVFVLAAAGSTALSGSAAEHRPATTSTKARAHEAVPVPRAQTGEPPSTPAAGPAGLEQPRTVRGSATAAKRHVNGIGGYRFLHPPGWAVERDGELSTVRSPNGHLVVSFALGPVGLPTSYDGFASLIVDSYRDVRIAGIETAYVGGRNSLSIRGSAVDGRGRPVSFKALLVDRGDRRSLGAFAATDTGEFDRRLDAVLASLRSR